MWGVPKRNHITSSIRSIVLLSCYGDCFNISLIGIEIGEESVHVHVHTPGEYMCFLSSPLFLLSSLLISSLLLYAALFPSPLQCSLLLFFILISSQLIFFLPSILLSTSTRFFSPSQYTRTCARSLYPTVRKIHSFTITTEQAPIKFFKSNWIRKLKRNAFVLFTSK